MRTSHLTIHDTILESSIHVSYRAHALKGQVEEHLLRKFTWATAGGSGTAVQPSQVGRMLLFFANPELAAWGSEELGSQRLHDSSPRFCSLEKYSSIMDFV